MRGSEGKTFVTVLWDLAPRYPQLCDTSTPIEKGSKRRQDAKSSFICPFCPHESSPCQFRSISPNCLITIEETKKRNVPSPQLQTVRTCIQVVSWNVFRYGRAHRANKEEENWIASIADNTNNYICNWLSCELTCYFSAHTQYTTS